MLQDDQEAQISDGEGVAYYESGNSYSGQFEDGHLQGTGIYTWKDGVTYTGEFVKNKIVGSGEYQWIDGSNYNGQVTDGIRNGLGVFSHGKQTLEGSWREGKPNGYGTCHYLQGGIYQGDWIDGRKHGNGVMTYHSGNVYDGEWRENVKAGQGTMTWHSKNEIYSGEWMNGKPNGFGEYTWKLEVLRNHQHPSNNIYKGNWLDGERNGFGSFSYSNGAKYDGEWSRNMKVRLFHNPQHGKGKFISYNGTFYEGVFFEDQSLERFDPFDNCKTFAFILAAPFVFHIPAGMNSSSVMLDINTVISRNIGLSIDLSLRQFAKIVP